MALRKAALIVVSGGFTLATELYIIGKDISKLCIIRGDIPSLERRLVPFLYVPDDAVDPRPAEVGPSHVARNQPGWLTQYGLSHVLDTRSMTRLARSPDHSVRLYALRNLCALHDLPDHRLAAVVQACDRRTLISLARCRHADPRIFTLPPYVQAVPSVRGGLLREMMLLLEGMDAANASDACARHFTSLLLMKMALLAQRGTQALRQDFADLDGSPNLSDCADDILVSDVLLKWFLQVLYLQTSDAVLRQTFVKLSGLQLMLRILERHSSHVNGLQATAAGVLSNLALDEGLHEAIAQSGSIALLATSLRTAGDSLLSSKAATALCNLDRASLTPQPSFNGSSSGGEANRDVSYLPGVVLLYPAFADQIAKSTGAADASAAAAGSAIGAAVMPGRVLPCEAGVDVILVHGLRGGPVKTWRQSDSAAAAGGEACDCWPRLWLPTDCPGLHRVLAVEYETTLTEWVASSYCPHDKQRRTIDRRADDILDKLAAAGVGSRPIVWLGHSLGGLLVERMLVHAATATAATNASPGDSPAAAAVALAADAADSSSGRSATHRLPAAERRRRVLDSTRAVVLCSVPHRGATLAGLSQHARYLLYPATEVQELRPGSSELDSLREAFTALQHSAGFRVVNVHETVKTRLGGKFSTLLVPGDAAETASEKSVDAKHIYLKEDHLGTCKPASKASPLYTAVVDLVNAASTK